MPETFQELLNDPERRVRAALAVSSVPHAPNTPPTMANQFWGRVAAYVLGVLIGADVLANAVIGGRAYSTISCRVGESIQSGGWASHVHWPTWWIRHCEHAIFLATV